MWNQLSFIRIKTNKTNGEVRQIYCGAAMVRAGLQHLSTRSVIGRKFAFKSGERYVNFLIAFKTNFLGHKKAEQAFYGFVVF